MRIPLNARTTKELQEAYRVLGATIAWLEIGITCATIMEERRLVARELDRRGITTAMTREANK